MEATMNRTYEDNDLSDSALDRLVMRELEALSGGARRPQRPARETAEEGEKVVYAHPYAERRRHHRAETETADGVAAPGDAKVVDFTLPQSDPELGLFSADEHNFIASAIDWLRGRENADLILEAIWSAAVTASDGDAGDAGDDDEASGEADTDAPPEADAEIDDVDAPDEDHC
jgi:hypothetical protein